MFEPRAISSDVEAIRAEHAPDAKVFDCERDFETLPPAQAEELGLVVDSLEPASYQAAWLPSDVPSLLVKYASSTFTIGMPGDGSVVWTRQTGPPVVLVKPRITGSPDSFVDFLLAEAFVELGCTVPEHFIGFFEAELRELDRVIDMGPNNTYQIAAAAFDGWIGLQTRDVFGSWQTEYPELFEAWKDAGARLEGRVSSLPREVARGDTDFADATELACAAIKHAIELPAPFAALDTDAYREHGPEYAIKWAEKTFESLAE